ncbi:putative non-specific serine/threonine protein kinase [Rosa chinensis]|uniref:Putative non-specific serine/threonine protein kinase n=1 Tax=Rosa chinensis TaxID=74649 RepID=A0A2P6RXK6_ROSCH|nr:putative non-specific serine/threonine protein kinase [Rosa chinensis]
MEIKFLSQAFISVHLLPHLIVVAITNIKETYKIRKNWQGDPCSPQAYSWEGINCVAIMLMSP